MIELERIGSVWLLRFRSGENRFNDDFIDELDRHLDEIEASTGPRAVVTTGTDKFYSNGLDLDWLATASEPEQFMEKVHRLLVRILKFPAFTVAAVNGHAFAAGAMLATAHDAVVMRSDRGYWCLLEVDLGLPLTPTMYAVLEARLPRVTLHEAILTGKRYDAESAFNRQIADEFALNADVLPRGLARAAEAADKNTEVLSIHKQLLYAAVTAG